MISAYAFLTPRKAMSGLGTGTKRRKWALNNMKIHPKSFKLFICKLCGIEKSSSIVRHYIHLRSHGLRTISRARYRCPSCLFYFTSPAWLKFHQSNEKRDFVKKRKLRWKLPYLAASPPKVRHSKPGGRKRVSWGRGVRGTKCEECDDYDGPELEEHLESVHGLVSPFKCRYCHFSNRFYSQYKLHRKTAHKPGWMKNGRRSSNIRTTKCAECSEYDGPNLLEHLEQVHRLTRPFQCSKCPFSTGAYSHFKIHKSAHRGCRGRWKALTKCRECDDYDGPELINHLAQAHSMTRPFQCPECPKVFTAYSTLLCHRKAHRPKEAPEKLGMGIKYELKMGIRCEECEEYEGRQVYSHVKAVHGLPRPFKCPHCDYSTEFYTNFKSHRASHFPPEDQEEAKPTRRLTKCEECDDYKGSELYSHLSEAHNLLKPFSCPKCSFKCKYYSVFKLHSSKCNRSGDESTKNIVHIPLTKQPLSGKNRQDVIICGECNEHDGLNVYEHLQNTHNMSRPFKCSQCEYNTDFYTNFKIHQGLHWPEKIQRKKGWNKLWKCKECNEYDGPELYAHLLDAHGMKKPLKCSLCDKVVSFYSHLLVHRKSHLKEATKCEECDEYEGADLKVHLQDKHGMIPPYICIHCKSQHINYTSLVKHRRSHKKEMIKCEECENYEGLDIYGHLETNHGMSPPFSCSICPEKFMLYSRLKRHHDVRRSKGGRCGECDAQVDTDLASHLESAHQLKSPFKCSMCHFTHKFYSVYKLHKENRHGIARKETVRVHAGRKASKCRDCRDYDGPNLMEHLESAHGLKSPFNCPNCDFTGTSYRQFTEHRKSHILRVDGQHKCQICGTAYEFLGHLTAHINRHHRQPNAVRGQLNKASLEQPDKAPLEQPSKTLMEQPSYTCPFCETNVIKLDLFKLHVLNHCQNAPQNPLKCHICGGFFATTNAFLEHVSDQHDPNAIQTAPQINNFSTDPQMMDLDMTNGDEGIHKESLRTFQEQDSTQGPYSPEVSLTENDNIYEPLNNLTEPQADPFEMDYEDNGVQDFDVDEEEEEEEDEQEIIGCQDCGQLFYTEESYLIHTTKHRVPFVTLTRAFRCQDKPIYV